MMYERAVSRESDGYSMDSNNNGIKRSSYRRVGGNANVDESLFGDSSADKRKQLRKAGRSIVSASPDSELNILSRSELSRMMNMTRNNSSEVSKVSNTSGNSSRYSEEAKLRKKKMQELAMDIDESSDPTVEAEVEARQKSNPLLNMAMRKMDEEDDDVKTLKTQLNTMKCLRIRQKQISEKASIENGRKYRDREWHAMDQASRVTDLEMRREEISKKKRTNMMFAEALISQKEAKERQRILDEEALEQEKQLMLAMYKKAEEDEIAAKQVGIHEQKKRHKELVMFNKTFINRKKEKIEMEKKQDQNIMKYLKHQDKLIAKRIAEEANDRAEKEAATQRLRAKQERAQDLRAHEDQIRAEKAQYEKYKNDQARLEAEDKARSDLMEEVMRVRDIQIKNRNATVAREAIDDIKRVKVIRRKQRKLVAKEQQEMNRKKIANLEYGESLKNQIRMNDEHHRVELREELELAKKEKRELAILQLRKDKAIQRKLRAHQAKGYVRPPKLFNEMPTKLVSASYNM